MPGKWSNLKGKVEKFQQDPGWQSEIEKAKEHYLGFSKLQLCSELSDEDLAKKRVEAELHGINTRREALSQLLLTQLEDEGSTTIKNAFGTFFMADEPYSKVADKARYLEWIAEQGLQSLLSVPYQSTNAQVKARLEAGETLPPGVEVFIKTQVRRRQA